jgi:hypothetical protein
MANIRQPLTNKNGEYHFPEGVTPAAYRIRASAEGFVWQTYSRDGTAEGQVQQIGETTHLRGIDFQLKREAVIHGILTGTGGEPVAAGVSVTVVRKQNGEQGERSEAIRGHGKDGRERTRCIACGLRTSISSRKQFLTRSERRKPRVGQFH